MRLKGKAAVCSAFAIALAISGANAQERDESKGNELSAHPIASNDILMKQTLWRRVDLKEKINLPMFSTNNEVTRYLLDAAKAGLLDAYTNDSCLVKLKPDELHKKLLIPNQVAGLSAEELAAGFGNTAGSDGWGAPKKEETKAAQPADDGWGAPKKEEKKAAEPVDDGWGPPKKKTPAKKGAKKTAVKEEPPVEVVAKPDTSFQQQAAPVSEEEYFPKQLSIIEIREDWTFDKNRSRLYTDIQTITIYIPADQNANGLELPVASFKYKDVDRLFRSDPKRYIWYNSQNIAQHKNLADAFDLRLWSGRIVKYSNPEDKSFVDLFKGEKEGLLKSIQFEQKLMEKEHGLWEY